MYMNHDIAATIRRQMFPITDCGDQRVAAGSLHYLAACSRNAEASVT